MATKSRTKLLVVSGGVGWGLFLIYVMSSMQWKPKGINKRDAMTSEDDFDPKDQLNEMVSLNKLKQLNDANLANSSAQINDGRKKSSHVGNNITESEGSKAVQVVISGDDKSIMGVIVVINSVIMNTKSPVHFYVTLPKEIIPNYLEWVSKSRLSAVHQTIRPHTSKIPKHKPHFAKIYFTLIFPKLKGTVIYLDSDVVVQGDIKEMSELKLKTGYYGVHPQDCTSVSKRFSGSKPRYSTHVNLNHPAIQTLNMINPSACTFNTDVFVANLTSWEEADLVSQLHAWITKNITEKIYGVDPDVDEAEAAMLIAMYRHTSPMPQSWHVNQLGISSGKGYSTEYLKKANLLHWSGHHKPWSRAAAAGELWQKYYIPDPTGRFKIIGKYN